MREEIICHELKKGRRGSRMKDHIIIDVSSNPEK
jgi:hypothetical protein